MRVLCTGGAGFVGSHLVDRLVAGGHEVTVLDDLSTGRRENVHPKVRDWFVGDVKDYERVVAEVAEADIVYHLAAAVGVKLIVEQPVQTLMTNLRGTENVLAACASYGKRVVIASSSEVYGKRENEAPIREDSHRVYGPVTQRRWAYGESKAIDEFLALAYRDEHGLDVRIARLFNTVGPRQSGRYGMVIPRFAQAVATGRPIEVYGNGEQTRSFCHVSDIVDGLIRLAEKPDPKWPIYNFGNPWNHVTINTLAKEIHWIGNPHRGGETTGTVSEIVHVPYDEVYGGIADMKHRRPDISRAYADLGWSPRIPLQAILEIAVRTAREEHDEDEA